MESNNSNQERASNSSRALTPEEVLSTDNYAEPNNQLLSYHRRFPDGKYIPVMLSPGYRFCPQDDELVVDFLNKEINKERPEYIRLLNINVYNHSPEELARTYPNLGNGEWYFFSPRERKYANGSRPNRAAGNGYWKATGADKKIFRGRNHVGSKKCLVFYVGKPPRGDKTDWIMHEYVSIQPPRQRTSAEDMRLDDCVLCRIYKKSEHSPRTDENGSADSDPGESSKSGAGQSSEGRKNRKRVKTDQNRGTNHHQQQNLSGLSRQNHQQQQQAMHHSTLQGSSSYVNPRGHLDRFGPESQMQTMQCTQAAAGTYNDHPDHHRRRLESNPCDGRIITDIITHQSFASPQQNLQQGMQYSDIQSGVYNIHRRLESNNIPDLTTRPIIDMAEQSSFAASPPPLQNQYGLPEGDYIDFGQQFDNRLESDPEEAQPITVWPNILDGEFDFGQGSIPQQSNLFHFDENLGNGSHSNFGGLIRNNTAGNHVTYPQTFQNGYFGSNQFYQFSSTGSSTPFPPPLDANDHPHENGEAMQRDMFVDRMPKIEK